MLRQPSTQSSARSPNHAIGIQQGADNHDTLPGARVSSKFPAAVAGGTSGFGFLFGIQAHWGGGIAVVCSAELSPKRGSEILPDGVEEESKG